MNEDITQLIKNGNSSDKIKVINYCDLNLEIKKSKIVKRIAEIKKINKDKNKLNIK